MCNSVRKSVNYSRLIEQAAQQRDMRTVARRNLLHIFRTPLVFLGRIPDHRIILRRSWLLYEGSQETDLFSVMCRFPLFVVLSA